MRAIKSVGIVLVVLGIIFLAYQTFIGNKHPTTETPTVPLSIDNSSAVKAESELSKKTVSKEESSVDLAISNTTSELLKNQNSQLSSDSPPLVIYDIGHEHINDEDLINLVNRLNSDPVLLAELINELRAEADPERLKRLVYILGATSNSAVLPAAAELIYSGDPSSRDAGLDLLRRLAPNNPEALSVASDILVSETKPDVIIATMNVMAQPASASPELRESLVAQITPLSSHEDTKVRSISVSILARLTDDPAASPVFYNALFDAESGVRSAGVYAYAQFPYHTAEASQKLLDIAEDAYEVGEVRRGAIFALKSNSPDEQTLSRLEAASVEMRRQAALKRKQRREAK